MATIAVSRTIDESLVVVTVLDAVEKLDSANRELILDFSSVRRIDASALCALEELARRAEEKSVKVALQGVNVEIYKTLKLMKLTSKFSFVN